MTGFVDLHCHYVPGIDDGVKTREDGVALLRALCSAGFEKVIATPHIRTAMFENRRAGLEAAFAAFVADVSEEPGLPALGLGAEHFFDDVVWELFQKNEMRPYPGDRAVLVEFPERSFPMGLDQRFFQMQVKNLRPVLAHPERYAPVQKDPGELEHLVDRGVLALLDVMSLVGKYGAAPQRAAEVLLERGLYYAACSDTHRPGDVDFVVQAIERLRSLRGDGETQSLLGEHPRRILLGTAG